jgi:spermidine synthase
MAALIAAFMLGMGLASSYVGARPIACRWYHLAALSAGLIALPLVAVGILSHAGSGAVSIPSHLVDVWFTALAFTSGALGGIIFAVASSFLIRKGRRILEAGILAYSLDLSGAMVAGFTTGFLIIPSLGITGSAYAVAVFNGTLLAALLVWGALSSRRAS